MIPTAHVQRGPSEAARCASTGIVPATPPPFSILLDAPRPPTHLSQSLFDMVTDVVIRLACQHGQQRRNHGGTESSQSVGGFRSRHRIAERIHDRGYGSLVSDRSQRSDSRAQCQYFFIPPIAAAVE